MGRKRSEINTFDDLTYGSGHFEGFLATELDFFASLTR